MQEPRHRRRAVAAAAAAVVAVGLLVGWRVQADSARWAAARAGEAPEAPLPETGQMRRRRGQR